MKAISIILFFISSLVYGQIKPIIINQSDTLKIGQKFITGQKLWVQTQESEIQQRFKIEELTTRIDSIKKFNIKIDSTYNLIESQNKLVIEKLKLKDSENSKFILKLEEDFKIQDDKILKLENSLLKTNRTKRFWRTTTIVLSGVLGIFLIAK